MYKYLGDISIHYIINGVILECVFWHSRYFLKGKQRVKLIIRRVQTEDSMVILTLAVLKTLLVGAGVAAVRRERR